MKTKSKRRSGKSSWLAALRDVERVEDHQIIQQAAHPQKRGAVIEGLCGRRTGAKPHALRHEVRGADSNIGKQREELERLFDGQIVELALHLEPQRKHRDNAHGEY